jgi:hypothetical protein
MQSEVKESNNFQDIHLESEMAVHKLPAGGKFRDKARGCFFMLSLSLVYETNLALKAQVCEV